jgi:predicted DNA binding protein
LLEAHISIEAPPVWRERILALYDARVILRDWHPREGRCCKVFLEIICPPDRLEALSDELGTNSVIIEHDLDLVGPGMLKGSLTTTECMGCCSASSNEVFQLNGEMGPDGRIIQTLVAPDRQTVREMISSMEAHGHTVTLLKLSPAGGDGLLTARQEAVLGIAMELGYFDDPRGVSLKKLAQRFNVSISTLSEVLRKAQHKVMSKYFGQPR